MSTAVLISDRTDRRLGDLARVTGWTVEQVIEAAVLAWLPPAEVLSAEHARQKYTCDHGNGPTPCRIGCNTGRTP